MEERRGPIKITVNGIQCETGAPGQPMGTCQYCGTGIAICCEIESADGRRFVVGSTCVEKTHNAKMIGGVKAANRERLAAKRRTKAATIVAEALVKLAATPALRAKLAAEPHPLTWRADKGETALDSVLWSLVDCWGDSARSQAAKAVLAM